MQHNTTQQHKTSQHNTTAQHISTTQHNKVCSDKKVIKLSCSKYLKVYYSKVMHHPVINLYSVLILFLHSRNCPWAGDYSTNREATWPISWHRTNSLCYCPFHGSATSQLWHAETTGHATRVSTKPHSVLCVWQCCWSYSPNCKQLTLCSVFRVHSYPFQITCV